jgi:photosystem II stability/assembly factor-like uncharacterized protein
MNKITLIISVFVFFVSGSKSQTGWYQQNSGTLSDLYSVFFVDASTGYAVGDSAILKTTNGGSNWSKQVTQNRLRSVFFLDANTGYTCGGHSIYKTTNAGNTWNTSYYNNSFIDARSIYFVNASTGMVAGSWLMVKLQAGAVIRTTNGGITWNSTLLFFPQALYSVNFPNAFTGYTGGTNPSFKTTNSGQNWIQISGLSTIYSIYFINAVTGWAAGGMYVGKTTSGGINWSSYALSGSLYSVRFANDQTGWVCGSGGSIYGSTNGGANWTLQSSGTATYLYSLSFVNGQTGWAAGATGRILKTTTGGLTYIQPVSNKIPTSFQLYQNYPNPFNPSAKIRFDISSSPLAFGEGQGVRLIIYDAVGHQVAVLVNDQLQPGTYELEFGGSNYPNGVYFYKLTAGDFRETKKMILMK